MRECKHPTCGETCRRPEKEKKVYQLKRTPLKKKPYKIKPVADKRRIQKQQLSELTQKLIDPWDECEIKSPVPGVCTFFATLFHHTNGKENERLLIVEDLMKSCAGCNLWIETSAGTAWAYENGKKKHKHQINQTPMNTDQLQKGTQLQSEISDLENHIDAVQVIYENEKINEKRGHEEKNKFPCLAGHAALQLNTITSNSYNDRIYLRSDFFTPDAFLFNYLNEANQRLAILKKQFEAL